MRWEVARSKDPQTSSFAVFKRILTFEVVIVAVEKDEYIITYLIIYNIAGCCWNQNHNGDDNSIVIVRHGKIQGKYLRQYEEEVGKKEVIKQGGKARTIPGRWWIREEWERHSLSGTQQHTVFPLLSRAHSPLDSCGE